ncbi:MAG: glycosyltransferase family 2 protein [Candidatus Micrarchaeia archaeon]|jgi:glycosyltransferase involved in cell wall biosynthesis
MLKPKLISIVIPTLNEEGNIGTVIKEVKKELEDYGYKYEIIVVDGHSTDKTAEIAKSLGAKVLYDSIGKGSALRRGMEKARGDIIVSMDADLSNKPNELRLLISGIEIGYDICMGSRFITGGGTEDMPLLRKFGNKIFVSLVNLFFGTNYTDLCYGYRGFKKGVFKKLNLTEDRFGIETEISIKAAKLGLKVLEVPSFEKKRSSGRGKLKSFRDGYAILKTIFKNLM